LFGLGFYFGLQEFKDISKDWFVLSDTTSRLSNLK
jgi:hypothetical protein